MKNAPPLTGAQVTQKASMLPPVDVTQRVA
jgi:hypothetical protein